jgi:hypothetical protein
MNTLAINDLARSEHLDRPTMATVRGGWKVGKPACSFGDQKFAGSNDSSTTVAQKLVRMQEVVTATANGSAFLGGVDVSSQAPQNVENESVRR